MLNMIRRFSFGHRCESESGWLTVYDGLEMGKAYPIAHIMSPSSMFFSWKSSKENGWIFKKNIIINVFINYKTCKFIEFIAVTQAINFKVISSTFSSLSSDSRLWDDIYVNAKVTLSSFFVLTALWPVFVGFLLVVLDNLPLLTYKQENIFS